MFSGATPERERSQTTVPKSSSSSLSLSNSNEESKERERKREIQLSASRTLYKREVFSPVAICLLSHWPFVELYRRVLRHIYHIFISGTSLPLERYLNQLLSALPLPPPGRVSVMYRLADETFCIRRPPPNRLPLFEFRMEYLFLSLSHENILSLFSFIATETKVLFISSSYNVLVSVMETFIALLFPFSWQCVYMPLLPRALLDYTSAPVPFMAGIHSSCLPYIEQGEDVVFVNLDKDEITTFIPGGLTHMPMSAKKKILSEFEKSVPTSLSPKKRGMFFSLSLSLSIYLSIYLPLHICRSVWLSVSLPLFVSKCVCILIFSLKSQSLSHIPHPHPHTLPSPNRLRPRHGLPQQRTPRSD